MQNALAGACYQVQPAAAVDSVRPRCNDRAADATATPANAA